MILINLVLKIIILFIKFKFNISYCEFIYIYTIGKIIKLKLN